MFDFPKLGLKLWREDNLTSKDLEDEKFTSLDEDKFEYYQEELYFETVLIYSGKYQVALIIILDVSPK